VRHFELVWTLIKVAVVENAKKASTVPHFTLNMYVLRQASISHSLRKPTRANPRELQNIGKKIENEF